MSDKPSCHTEPAKKTMPSCCDTGESAKPRTDYLFWGGLVVISIGYLYFYLFAAQHEGPNLAHHFTAAIFELMNMMFLGVVMGIVAMGFLSRVPRDFIMSMMGSGRGIQGIFRATLAGVLLDLCSHGILMVGAKLYERGVTVGQLMAFLIASPWNSFSLTLILVSLIGLKLTLIFIALSAVIAIITGIIFDQLVVRGVLPENPNTAPVTEGFRFLPEAKKGLASVKWTPRFFYDTLKTGFMESRMILRWLFLGVIIASVLRVVMSPDMFSTWFGPSLIGLGVTLLAATIIEVCSEGATPIAADIITRAGAAGNGFTFLMAGVATDYTEIMVLRETTKSWKISLFLPLITVPQVLVLGYILNQFGG